MFKFFHKKPPASYEDYVLKIGERVYNLEKDVQWLRDAVQGLQTKDPVAIGDETFKYSIGDVVIKDGERHICSHPPKPTRRKPAPKKKK
jgi:hypothetical protein